MKKFGLVIMTVSLAFAGAASAATEKSEASASGLKFLAGLSMGSGSYNNDFGTKMAWGLDGDVRIGDSYQVGASYRTSKLASDEATSTNIKADYLLFTGDYRMAAGSGYFFGGVEAGSAKVSLNLDMGIVSLEGDSVTKFAAGPRVGYQFPINEKFEVAATADYLTVFTAPTKLHSLGLLASAAYSF